MAVVVLREHPRYVLVVSRSGRILSSSYDRDRAANVNADVAHRAVEHNLKLRKDEFVTYDVEIQE